MKTSRHRDAQEHLSDDIRRLQRRYRDAVHARTVILDVLQDNPCEDTQRYALMLPPRRLPLGRDPHRYGIRELALQFMPLNEEIAYEVLGSGSSTETKEYELSRLVLNEGIPATFLEGVLSGSLPGVPEEVMSYHRYRAASNPLIPFGRVVELLNSAQLQILPSEALSILDERPDAAVWVAEHHPELVGFPCEWIASAIFIES